ncbi:MAG: helix-turn-helix domain-containing protein [Planctomycetia bacterium]|nr:helix-turn-helix domain-containing protein [Planctomycetia bacterium]
MTKRVNKLFRYGAAIHPGLEKLGLTPNQYRIYCYLIFRTGNNEQCWPSISTIAADCRMGKTTVKKGLAELRTLELVKPLPCCEKSGRRTSNRYVLLGISGKHQGSPNDWGTGRHATGHRSPDDHKYISDECITKEIIHHHSNPSKTRQCTALLTSESLPESLYPFEGAYTASTLNEAWKLTKSYYPLHTFAKTRKAMRQCVSAFAAQIQSNSRFGNHLQAYLKRFSSLPPESLQEQIRQGQLLSLQTTPWELVKHINRNYKSASRPIPNASNSSVLAGRAQRRHAAQTKPQAQSETLTPETLKENLHV